MSIASLQPEFWYWWVAAAIFVGLEIFTPGVAFLWLGIAAVLVGLLVAFDPSLGFDLQLLVFAVLSIITVVLGRRFVRLREPATDQPTLNRRAESYVGRTVTLTDAIVDGTGRAAVGDGTWIVRGDDMPAGTRVRITGTDGIVLLVERAP